MFSEKLNKDMHVFQDSVIMDGLQTYLAGSPHLSIGWWACINTIVAHTFRHDPNLSAAGDAGGDKYFYNALSLIPTMILQPPEELCIGSLLSMVRT